MVMCGKIEADWLLIFIASSWFATNNYMLALSDSISGGVGDIIKIPNRIDCHRLDSELHQLPLTSILRMLRAHEATDPRDKVFALINLSNEAGSQNPHLLPDYSKSMAHVYRDVSRYLIEAGSLDVLSAVSWVPNNRSPLTWKHSSVPMVGGTFTKTTKMWGPPDESIIFPSWVPRWDSTDMPFALSDSADDKEVYSTSGNLPLEIILAPDENVLILRGIAFDIMRIQRKTLQQEEYDAWKVVALAAGVYPAALLLMVFHATMTAGLTLNRTHIESDTQHQANISAFVTKMAKDISEADDGNASDYMQLVQLRCDTGRIFTTSGGYMGLGPKGMLIGDTICVLYGGLTPYVLRKEKTSWRFIGEFYVHGIMHGEAVQSLGKDAKHGEIFEIR